MLASPFALAAGAKAPAPRIPLWALVIGAQLLNLGYLILHLAGLEGTDQAALLATPGPGVNSEAPYSHALLTAFVVAVLAGLVARAVWGTGTGLIMALVVGAPWLLDLLLYQDLPILPGEAAGLGRYGLGLDGVPPARAIIEVVLVLGGAFLYYRATMRLPAPSIRSSQEYRVRAFTAALVTAVLLLGALAVSLLGLD